jgi:actin
MDVRKEFYGNIVLAGGTTMFRDITERLTKNIGNLAPSTLTPHIYSPAERKHSAWIGGSILASLKSFESMWITKQDWETEGDHIVHRRCF